MLINMLSDTQKKHFIDLADLLIIANLPLLWDGKPSDEITSSTDLSALSLKAGKHEFELIAELENYTGKVRNQGSMLGLPEIMLRKRLKPTAQESIPSLNTAIVDKLVNALKAYPFMKLEQPEVRTQAASSVLSDLLEDKTYDLPATPKIILFELLLVALRDGSISDIKLTLLKKIQIHHGIEDFIFDDLLERAEITNQETSKTISMILE